MRIRISKESKRIKQVLICAGFPFCVYHANKGVHVREYTIQSQCSMTAHLDDIDREPEAPLRTMVLVTDRKSM